MVTTTPQIQTGHEILALDEVRLSSAELLSYDQLLQAVQDEPELDRRRVDAFGFMVPFIKLGFFQTEGVNVEQEALSLLSGRRAMDVARDISFARDQGVYGIIHQSLRPAILSKYYGGEHTYSEIANKLDSHQANERLKRISIIRDTRNMLRIFDELGIQEYVVWKSNLPYEFHCGYDGERVIRRASDVDFLVRRENLISEDGTQRLELVEQLGKVGYKVGSVSKAEMGIMNQKREKSIDLRFDVIDKIYEGTGIPLDKLFNSCVRTAQGIPVLDSYHQFITLSLHGVKHGFENLKWVVDLAAMLQNSGNQGHELDWDRIMDFGNQRSLMIPMLLGPALSNIFFGVPLPDQVAQLLKSDSTLVSTLNELSVGVVKNITMSSDRKRPYDQFIERCGIRIIRSVGDLGVDVFSAPEQDRVGKDGKLVGNITGTWNRFERIRNEHGGSYFDAFLHIAGRVLTYVNWKHVLRSKI